MLGSSNTRADGMARRNRDPESHGRKASNSAPRNCTWADMHLPVV